MPRSHTGGMRRKKPRRVHLSKQPTSVFDGPVVIVGAGVTGLVTGHLLAEAGVDVVIIEKLDDIGGLARSFVYDDFVFDCGPHRFHTANPQVSSYLNRVIERHTTYFPRKSEVFFKGKYYGWPIKPKNLLQLPPEIAAKSFVDLTVNGFREYGDDNFEDYILKQYGPTLYEHFFRGYSEKFLGIHPRETHSDWAKVGINRAIIDDNAQMQNLFQLLKTTLTSSDKEASRYLYPKKGMYEAWEQISQLLIALKARIITGTSATMEREGNRITRVHAGSESFVPSRVIWTAPITLACSQLELQRPDLNYLGLLLYNLMVNEPAPRDYQWCYYGEPSLLLNRVSVPRFFSEATCPPMTTGYCCEVTCMEGDARWQHAERLTDWIVDDMIKVGMIKHRDNVFDVRVERLPASYPIYHSRYPEELDLARRQLEQFDNLHLAGRTGLFWYNNMDHSIENAMQLSSRLLRESGVAHAEEAAIAAGMPSS
jgi:protoporphyrinogen oxidase